MAGPNPTNLEKAVRCYEELDYACAETRLAEALGDKLSEKDLVKVRYYEALVAIAWRNSKRARRSVRAIFELDPTYQPKNAPPLLAEIFVAERPAPIPPPRLLVATGYRHTVLVDSGGDAAWWLGGHGPTLSVGFLVKEKYGFGLGIAYGSHAPQNSHLGLRGLSMWTAETQAYRRWNWGALNLKLGGAVGIAFVSTDVEPVYDDLLDNPHTEPFVGTLLGVGIEANYTLWKGVGIGISIQPTVLIRNFEDQPHLSYLLPIQVGLRYGE